MTNDIMFFIECHSNPATDLNNRNLIPAGFDLIQMTGSSNVSLSTGQICFAKPSMRNKLFLLADNSNEPDSILQYFEISLFKLDIDITNTVYICVVYSHPTHSQSAFITRFNNFIEKHIDWRQLDNSFYVIGDLNFDYNPNMMVYKGLKQRQLDIVNPSNASAGYYATTDSGSRLDVCLTNVRDKSKYSHFLYESYFSDHKPLILQLLQ